MLRFILGTLASAAVVVLVIVLENGSLLAYLGLTPGLIALLLPFFAVLAVWPLREWAKAWKDAFIPKESPTTARSSSIWNFQEKACYAAGAIGFLAGLVLILSQLSTVSRLGPALAMSLVCPMYSLLLGLVARILRARVDRARP
jgi:flagellar motor component MotA